MANRVMRGLTWTVNWMYFDRKDKGDNKKGPPKGSENGNEGLGYERNSITHLIASFDNKSW